jgi:hypothetical protein
MHFSPTLITPFRLLACGLWASSVLAAELNVPAGATLQIPGSAALQLGCADLTTAGTALVNAGQIQQAGNVIISPTGALNGGTGTIQVGGNWNNSGTFIAGSGSVMFVDGCSTAPASLSGDTSFNQLVLTSQIGRTFVIEAGRNIGVTGSLIVQGTSAAPVRLVTSSSTGQVAYVTLAPGASYTATDASIPPTVRIVDPTPPPPPPNPIPTLGEWGRGLLMLLLALAAMVRFPMTSHSQRPRLR